MARLRSFFTTRFLIVWLTLSLCACDTSPPIDPRKELNDIGIQYSEEEYLRCIVENDVRAVKLLLLAGMPMVMDVPENPKTSEEYSRRRDLEGTDGYMMALAAINGNRETVELFIEMGAKIEPVVTVLSKGAYGEDRQDRFDAIRIVIESVEDWESFSANTAFDYLNLALYLGSNDTAMLLLDQGAPIKPPDDSDYGGAYLLSSALTHGDEEMVRELIERGARVNTVEGSEAWKLGASVVSLAVQQENIALVKLVVDAGADVNFGEPAPLAWAIDNRVDVEIIDFLVARGANVDELTPTQRASWERLTTD